MEKLRKDTRCNIILKVTKTSYRFLSFPKLFKTITTLPMLPQGKGTKHNQDSENESMHLTIRWEQNQVTGDVSDQINIAERPEKG